MAWATRCGALILTALLGSGFMAGPAWPVLAAEQATDLRLIVLPLKLIGSGEEWLGESFAEHLTLALSQSPKLVMIERAQLDRVLREQGFAQSALADESTAPALGRMLGARELVLGSLQAQGEQLNVSLRRVDAATGQLVPGSAVQVTGRRDQLSQLQQQAAVQLLQKVAGVSALEAQSMVAGLELSSSAQAQELYHRSLGLMRRFSDANLQQAIRQLEQAVKIDPEFTLAYALLSEAHAVRAGFRSFLPSARPDDMEQALNYAKKALSLGNNLAAVYRALARAHFVRGNLAEARKAIEQALADKPGDPLSIQAWLDYRSKENVPVEQLRRELRELGANMDDPDLVLVLAQMEIQGFKRQRPPDSAAVNTLLRQLQASDPGNPYIALKIAELEVLRQRPAEAKAIVDKALGSGPDNFMLHFAAATIFFDQPQYQAYVEERFRRALALNPNFGFAHTFLGMFYLSHERNAEARERFLMAHQLQPESAFALVMLSSLAEIEDSLAQAYAYALRALENQGKILGETVSRGDILLALIRLGYKLRRPELNGHIQQLLAGGPSIQPAHYRRLVNFQIGQKDYAAAEQSFTAYSQQPGYQLSPEDERLYRRLYLLQQLELRPGDAAVLNDLGQLALVEQDAEKAADYLGRALKADPKQAVIQFNYGLLLMQLKRPAEAIPFFEKVLVLQPGHAKARFQIGEARLRLGDKAGAKQIWETLLAEDPSNGDVLRALEGLRN